MKLGCPNKQCAFYQNNTFVKKDGFYKRKDDSRYIQRFKCRHCMKKFSRASFHLAFNQKKRRVNHKVFLLLASGLSQRRIAKILGINKITVARKVVYLSQKAERWQKKFWHKLKEDSVMHLQFDDLITSEHTKMKPLSVSLAVDGKRRFILDTQVSSIPAFGHLAKRSRAKYGRRPNHHKIGLDQLFKNIVNAVSKTALIESDEHKSYPPFVSKYFPESEYKCYIGGRGCVAGQGELKKKQYDPLFTLNHSCAMLRANINRLIRKTWCTTKNPTMLKAHLNIFVAYYNQELLKLI